ncbi:DUF2339 domain-containing protein [Ramlibacter alkalitolerans]|uniref:DUF2339 domain-containing protein n=1 Tax=Ramlibacter alkalitolerans TaxID=2039631 RepID=A0ABS1JRM2_9BURK|nr:DUF2339 domain-containing protein [Ramlibacter alkalitolerans]MBL0426924.1 DUF2339 domain-containing protein [Ramlibacter alkalitolerans]
MVMWGAAWGALLGALWGGGGEWAFHVFAGAVLGALAAWTLRRALRGEIERALALRMKGALPAVTRPAPRPVAPAPSRLEPAHEREPLEIPTVPAALSEAQAPGAPPRGRTSAEPDLVSVLVQRARDWLLGGNTVVRMGVVVLFIGLAFLAKYAVEHALLPPELRLAAIGAAGIALFVLGLRLRSRRPDRLGYATTLQGAGIGVLYLTVFAAFRLYQFLPAGAAFVLLGLVCLFGAVIALALDAQALAFIAFAGGFAAPVLVSTGQGSHVGLFGYYVLLGAAIAVIAWLRAWRALNLLGFFATFGIATLWGVLRYQPRDFGSTGPFLLAFFALYLLASLFYALRHGQAARKAVDATLVFGTPIVAFGLQAGLVRDMPYAMAFSALALGGLYVALGWWLLRRGRGDPTVNRWLAECFVALALGFLTLAVPLAVDGRWTSAVWAVEGAGVYWMARRQQRWLARAFALALQVLAALLFLDGRHGIEAAWPIANPAFLGATMLAGAAFAIAWWSRDAAPQGPGTAMERQFTGLEAKLSPVLFWIGFLWWQAALGFEIDRLLEPVPAWLRPLSAGPQQGLLQLAAWVLSAYALHQLAWPTRRTPWRVAATPAWLNLPLMLLVALGGMATLDHVFQGAGWLVWPMVVAAHLACLRRIDDAAPRALWPWQHAGGVWLLVLLAGNLLVFAVGQAQLWRTAWASVILLVAASVVLLALVAACRRPLRVRASAHWPLDRFIAAYAWRAAAPVAAGLTVGALLVAVSSSGETRPLPYLPLLNPTDLAVALALAVCARWLLMLRASALHLPAAMRGPVPGAVLAGVGFVAINTVWLRIAHHYAGVAWDAHSLSSSFLVQAGYSILWTVIALVLMVAAHRRALRLPWMLGAGLLGLTVLKLFVVDLSNRGGSERIVVFIAVGLLMLVVGWFAPLPPAPGRKGLAAEGSLEGVAP